MHFLPPPPPGLADAVFTATVNAVPGIAPRRLPLSFLDSYGMLYPVDEDSSGLYTDLLQHQYQHRMDVRSPDLRRVTVLSSDRGIPSMILLELLADQRFVTHARPMTPRTSDCDPGLTLAMDRTLHDQGAADRRPELA